MVPANAQRDVFKSLDCDEPEQPNSQAKKKWNILRTMFSGPSNPKPGEVTPPGSSSEESESNSRDSTSQDDEEGGNGAKSSRPATPHQVFCFRFSLEWLDRMQWPSKNRRLFTPCLPKPSQLLLQAQRSPAGSAQPESESVSRPTSTSLDGHSRDVLASKIESFDQTVIWDSMEISAPSNLHLVSSKYAGRALAEWAHVVAECDNFFERRRDEGVPSDKMVETPTLGVETFRK